MSVIIKALKRLKHKPVATGEQNREPRPRADTRALSGAHALLYSVTLLILISAIISGITRITRRPLPLKTPVHDETRDGKTAENRAPANTPKPAVNKATRSKPAAPERPPVFQPKAHESPDTGRTEGLPPHNRDTTGDPMNPGPEKKTAPDFSPGRPAPFDAGISDTAVPQSPGITEGEKRFLANREKSLKVGKLVQRIETALARGTPELVPPLIKKLEELKGKEDDYVLKLKAFWMIRQNNYRAGAVHLAKVLKKNRADLEAGINMAVIEINTRQLQKALKRLKKLGERHPDNPRIHNLILKIKQSL